jgi:hypothetical protein
MCRGAAVAAILVLMVQGGIEIGRGSEPYYNNDEPRHIMTAVFWHDLLRVMPVHDPVGFAKTYYGHFPGIAPVHWPPLLHALTGGLFFLTGPGVAVARIVVLAMTALMLLATFALAKRCFSERAAAVAVLLLASSSFVRTFQSVFMLEMPCLLWMVLSVLTFTRYVQTHRSRYVWLCAVVTVAAALTKQHGLALLPALFLTAIASSDRKHWRDAHFYAAVVLVLALCGGYYGLILNRMLSSWADVSMPFGHTWRSIGGYVLGLGPHTAAMALCGIVLVCLSPRRSLPRTVCIVWTVCVLLFFLGMGVKEPRYLVYCSPPLAILAAGFFCHVAAKIKRPVGVVLTLALIAVFLWNGIQVRSRRLSGYREAAEAASQMAENGIVVFGGLYDGPFVLYRRLRDPELRSITFRVSKLVGCGNVFMWRDYRPEIHSPEELRTLFSRIGAAVVVLEEQPEIDRPEHRWFWQMVEGQDFELRKRVGVEYPLRTAAKRELYIYRYLRPTDVPDKMIIPMHTLGSEIVLDPREPLLHYGSRSP